MTAHKRHATTKDSGVAWLGKIPAHWDVMQSRRMFDERKEKARPGDVLLTASQKYGMIPQTVFMELEGRRVVEINKGADSLIHVEAGDFVISLRSFQGGLEFSRTAGSITFHYVPIHAVKWVHEPFFAHLFKSSTYIQALRATANLIRDGQDMRFTHFAQVPLPKIPMDEQVAIANHLDRETARIDKLIVRKTRFIELLTEKRQALITHAVTKGLNPKAKMKDSGVEWLDKVPAHWDVLAIRRLSTVRRGASPRPIDDPKYFDEQGDYAWVRISDVSASRGLLTATEQRLSELGASFSVKLEPGALFVSIAGTVGKPCITQIRACIHDGFVYFPLLRVPPEFLFRVFEAGQCYVGLGKLGTQLNLNTETIGSIKIALPPLNEMREILSHLRTSIARIDKLIAKTERSVDLLREHRTALITAAVTGKIDLREPA